MRLKILLTIISFLVATKGATAQISMENMRLNKPDSNILFRGIDNWIKVTLPTEGTIRLVSENGNSISTLEKNKFVIKPEKVGHDVLKVYLRQKLIFHKRYSIDTLGDFRVQLGNLNCDTASVNEILANKGLRCPNKNRLVVSQFRVNSFKTICLGTGMDTLSQSLSAIGNQISTEQQFVIRELTKKEKLIFYNMLVSGPGAKSRNLGPLTIVIK